MTSVLYELSTKTRVSLIVENGKSYVKLDRDAKYDKDTCPVLNREEMAFRLNDVYVLDSTKSGPELRTKDTGFYGRILGPLFDDLFKIEHTYVATSSSSSIHEFSSGLKSHGRPILMIIIAGDTSVGEFVNSLSENNVGKIKIFVVPAGTGNSLALSLGILDESKAVQKLFQHTDINVSPFQLYQAGFPDGSYLLENTGSIHPIKKPLLFVVVASWAFHASLVADSDSEEMRKHGINRFKVAAHQNLTRIQEYNGVLSIDSESGLKTIHQGPFAYLVITPSQKFEPTFNILPKGNIFNSDLYVVGFKTERNETYILDIMKEVYNDGNHIKDERVFYDRVTEHLSISLALGHNQSSTSRRFCIDGAIVIVPDTEVSTLTIGYHGSKVNDWDIFLIG